MYEKGSDLKNQQFFQNLDAGIKKQIDLLIPFAAKMANLTPSDFKSRLRAKDVVSTDIINAKANSTDDWKTFDVFINLGLMMFLHHTSKLLASRVLFNESDILQHDVERIFNEFQELATVYFSGSIISHQGLLFWELNEKQKYLAATVLMYMERFVLAHELGHVIINICQHNCFEFRTSKNLVTYLLIKDPYLSQFKDCAHKNDWAEEFASDNIALKLTTNTAGSEAGIAYISCELFLLMVDILERFYLIRDEPPFPTDTHPPAKARLSIIRSITKWEKKPKEGLESLGILLERVSTSILSKLWLITVSNKLKEKPFPEILIKTKKILLKDLYFNAELTKYRIKLLAMQANDILKKNDSPNPALLSLLGYFLLLLDELVNQRTVFESRAVAPSNILKHLESSESGQKATINYDTIHYVSSYFLMLINTKLGDPNGAAQHMGSLSSSIMRRTDISNSSMLVKEMLDCGAHDLELKHHLVVVNDDGKLVAAPVSGFRIGHGKQDADSIALHAKESLLKVWDEGLDQRSRQDALEDAEKGFQEALELDPQCVVALVGMGQILAKRDRKYGVAIQFFYDKAIALDPSNVEAWMLKACSLADSGQRQEALDCIDTAIDLWEDATGRSFLQHIRKKISG